MRIVLGGNYVEVSHVTVIVMPISGRCVRLRSSLQRHQSSYRRMARARKAKDQISERSGCEIKEEENKRTRAARLTQKRTIVIVDERVQGPRALGHCRLHVTSTESEGRKRT